MSWFKNRTKKHFCIFGSVTMLLITILIILYAIKDKETSWNQNAIKTKCIIINYVITSDSYCPQQTSFCNTGYIGSIMVRYNISKDYDGSINSTVWNVCGDQYYDIMIQCLHDNYKLNNTISCYYNRNDPSDVKLQLDNIVMIDIMILIGVIFIILFALISIIYELYIECKCRPYNSYRDPITSSETTNLV
jgi:hypothetical protein